MNDVDKAIKLNFRIEKKKGKRKYDIHRHDVLTLAGLLKVAEIDEINLKIATLTLSHEEEDLPRWERWLDRLNPIDRAMATIWLRDLKKEYENETI